MDRTSRRRFFQATAAAALPLVSRADTSVKSSISQVDLHRLLGPGISLAGAEFAAEKAGFSNQTPGVFGVEYTYNSRETVQALVEAGFRTIRLPFRWERLQPRLGDKLHEPELERIHQVADWAQQAGAYVALDLHNYGRYVAMGPEGVVTRVVDEPVAGPPRVTRRHFADLWSRLARRFAPHPAVIAYSLMNEPHDLGRADWQTISQAAVDSIRVVDQRTLIFVAGDHWSQAHNFGKHNGPTAWIRDPAGRSVYEAHLYFDADRSGKYVQPYRVDAAIGLPPIERAKQGLVDFFDWTTRNQVAGVLGEFGAPGDRAWLAVLSNFAQELEATQIPGIYWAAGEWWGNYPLSIQPTGDGPQPAQLRALAPWLASHR